MSSNKLKLKTLPTTTDSQYITPIVSPRAVQGNFPKLLNSNTESATNLETFLDELQSFSGGINQTIVSQIDTKWNELSKDDSGNDISFSALKEMIDNLNTRINNLSVIPKGTIVKSYNFFTYPDGSTITGWKNGECDLSVMNSHGWNLIATQEVLTCLKSFVLQDVSSTTDSHRLCSLDTVWGYFKEKYPDFVAPTSDNDLVSYKIENGKIKQVNDEEAEGGARSRLFGSVLNGDANSRSQHAQSLHFLVSNGVSEVWIVWQMKNDGTEGTIRFNVEFTTVRPCCVWKKA